MLIICVFKILRENYLIIIIIIIRQSNIFRIKILQIIILIKCKKQQSAFYQSKKGTQNVLHVTSDIISIPVQISISDQIVKDFQFIKHTVYKIEGKDRLGEFIAFRRYSDFYELREVLMKKWPGCYVPPIPQKLIASGNDYDVVRLRKKLLHTFLQILSQIDYIYYSDDVSLIFLRSSQDVSKINSAIQIQSTLMVLDRMKLASTSIPLVNLMIIPLNLYIIEKFQEYFKKSQNSLKGFLKQALLISQSRKQLNEERRLIYLQLLPRMVMYQQMWAHPENIQQIEKQIENKQIQANDSEQMAQLLETLNDNYTSKNPIGSILDFVEFDQQNSEAMQQCLNYRDNLIKNQDQLEHRVKECQLQYHFLNGDFLNINQQILRIHNLTIKDAQMKWSQMYEAKKKIIKQQELINIVTSLIARQEIHRYKINKLKFFQQMLNETKQQEKQMCESENQLLLMLKEQLESQQ